jgi:ketosteroid isomerase-like protein
MNIKRSVLLISLFMTVVFAQAQSKDSMAVTKATKDFVKAFINFDWVNFKNSFSNSATIFFPSWEEGKRRTGKKEIEETWQTIFPEFIDSAKKFDLKIDPKDVHMQLYGNTAIITFHLSPSEKYLSRRTIVFVKERDQWKIVHLHASSMAAGK